MFLFALLFHLLSCVEIVPGHMVETRGIGGGVLELNFRMGTPPRDVRMAVDGSHGQFVLSQDPSGESYSAFTTPDGVADLVHLGGKHFTIPGVVNPQFVYSVCPTCDGVIGIGGRSPLWLIWREIEVTPRGLRLGEKANTAHSILKDEWAVCKQPSSVFCNTTGSVFGEEVVVLIAPESPKTVLPASLFRELRGGRTLKDEWPDLTIHLDSKGVPGARSDHLSLTIPGRQVLRDTTGEPSVLTVVQQAGELEQPGVTPVVVIGWETLRATSFLRNFNTGRVAFDQRITERNMTMIQALFNLAFWIGFFYFKLRRPLFRIHSNITKKHRAAAVCYMIADVLASLAPFVFFWQRGTWTVFSSDLLGILCISFTVIISSVWLVLSVFFLVSRAPERWGVYGNSIARLIGGRAFPRIREKEMSYDMTSISLDEETRIRLVRGLIVHDWARDISMLMTLWLINTSTASGTLRDTMLFAVSIFILVVALGNPLLSLFFSNGMWSPAWLAASASMWAVLACSATFFCIRVVYPWSEMFSALFYLQPGLVFVAIVLTIAYVTLFFFHGHLQTMRLYVLAK